MDMASATPDFLWEASLKMPKTLVRSMLVSNLADFCGPAPVWSYLYGAGASESAQNVRPECREHLAEGLLSTARYARGQERRYRS
jgi:hypothetical protein